MENIKEVIAKNLTELRRTHKMTQQQLADKLGYSPKAISRWERGETLPDIEMLCKICDMYGVKFEYLLKEEQPAPSKNPNIIVKDTKSRLSITAIAFLTVWIVASTAFLYSNVLGIPNSWILFIWALPTSGAVLIICNRKWGNRILGFIARSYTVWTLILSIYLHTVEHNMWMLFIIGIPIHLILLISLTLKKENK